ncbi:MAG TPA: CoA-binding protein [Polyangiaceae bacterium]|nr:CoA-binding protein [Polyangiaceae bacterium]
MAHQNPPDEELRRLLTDARTIAVVGASSSPERPSHGIFGRLLAAGYRVLPVNPNESVVQGQKAYASLRDIHEPVDIVDVFRRPEHTPAIADDALAIGAKCLWLQSGIWNEEAAARASAGGLVVVMDECIGVAYSRLRVPRIPREGREGA